MKYYAMLFGDEASGVCPANCLLDAAQENHGSLTIAEISKMDFDKFGDDSKPKLGKRFSVNIVESVKLTAL